MLHSGLRKILLPCWLALSAGFPFQIVVAQSDVFSSTDVLELTLESPYSKINRSRGDDREYFPATIRYSSKEGIEVAIDLRIRTRGRSRSQEDICRFPPLRLNFDSKGLQGTIFDGENNLKMVTHCQLQERYDQFVLLELLNYRLFNLFTNFSFRVRQLEITYVDTETGTQSGPRAAFIIEDEKKMISRIGMRLHEAERITYHEYDSRSLNMVELYQYLIGNTDWSAFLVPAGENCCHNIVPVVRDDGRLIPIPYDFDATGMVNAPYSIPSPVLGIRSVRERMYRGYCHEPTVVNENISGFIARREDVLALIKSQPGFDQKTIDYATEYVGQFFDMLDDPVQLKSEISDTCRG